MADSSHDTSSTAGGKERSFLQQTTSRLLQQQEALRRRREVLERESRQPPVMRFGLGSVFSSRPASARTHSSSPPPDPVARVRSAAPLSAPSSDTRAHTSATTPTAAAATVLQPPMRFSLSHRPTPTPSASLLAALRTASLSPTPIDVNRVEAQVRSLSGSRKRTRSQRRASPPPVSSVDGSTVEDGRAGEPAEPPPARDIPVEIFLPRRRGSTSHPPEANVEGGQAEVRSTTPPADTTLTKTDERVSVTGKEASTTPTPHRTAAATHPMMDTAEAIPQEHAAPVDVTPPRRLSEFPLPRYTPSRSLLARGSTTPVPSSPPPPTRPSVALAPPPAVAWPSALGLPNPPPALGEGLGAYDGSPAPTPEDLIASVEVSAEKHRCERPPPRGSPVETTPTPRPCGCERPVTPSPRPAAPAFTAASPSTSTSTNAARLPRPPCSPSPWPTTENVVQSLTVAVAAERGRRPPSGQPARARTPAPSEEERAGGRGGGGESALCGLARTPSPGLTPRHIMESIHASGNRGRREELPQETEAEKEVSQAATDTAASAASPVPTDVEIAASVLVALEKRRAERPTPADHRRSPALADAESPPTTALTAPTARVSWTTADSASPIPTVTHLLESLEVMAETTAGRSDAPTADRPEMNSGEAGSPSTANAQPGEGPLSAPPASSAGSAWHVRTPSPVPTPELLEASVLASAEKRRRPLSEPLSAAQSRSERPLMDGVRSDGTEAPATHSGASAMLHEGGGVSLTSMDVCSPSLTAQHVARSVVTAAAAEAGHAARSPAQEPLSPVDALSMTRYLSPLPQSASGTNASPELTDANIAESVTVAAEEATARARRCGAVAPARAATGSTTPTMGVNAEDADAEGGFSNATSASEASVAMVVGEPVPSIAAPATSASVSASDVCVDSAMFKDCVSAAPTPALPHLPPQFFALQDAVKAISQGRPRRSCSHTPPPPPQQTPQDTRRPSGKASTPLRGSADFLSAAEAAADEAAREALTTAPVAASGEAREPVGGRRSSTLLVGTTPPVTHTPAIQHPHQPLLAECESPTPATVHRQVQTEAPRQAASRGRPGGEPMRADSHYYTPQALHSPLPRPVPLSAMVRPAAAAASGGATRLAPVSRTPPAVPPPPLPQRLAMVPPLSHSPREGRSTPYPRGSTCMRADGSVVVMQSEDVRRLSGVPDGEGGEDEELLALSSPAVDADGERSPSDVLCVSSERGSGVTVTVSAVGGVGGARKRIRGAPEAREASSDITSAMANTPVHGTPRGSGRLDSGGRRTAVGRLFEALPDDAKGEALELLESDSAVRLSNGSGVASVSQSSLIGTRKTTDTISSELSESGSGQLSIAGRVAQRPRRVEYDYDYYLKYFDELARESAKKVRKASAKRLQQKFTRDARAGASGKAMATKGSPAPKQAPIRCDAVKASPARPARGSRSSTVGSPGEEVAVSPLSSNSEGSLRLVSRVSGAASSTTPTPARRKLSVATRLSAELRGAIFDGAPASPSGTDSGTTPRPKTSTPAGPSPTVTTSHPSRKARLRRRKEKRKEVKAARRTPVASGMSVEVSMDASSVAARPSARVKSPAKVATKVDGAPAAPAAAPAAPPATARKGGEKTKAAKKAKKAKKKLAKKSPVATSATSSPPAAGSTKKEKKLRKAKLAKTPK